MSDVLRSGAARLKSGRSAVTRALTEKLWRPLDSDDEEMLAADYFAARGSDRPRELRAKEAHEHAEGGPVVTRMLPRQPA